MFERFIPRGLISLLLVAIVFTACTPAPTNSTAVRTSSLSPTGAESKGPISQLGSVTMMAFVDPSHGFLAGPGGIWTTEDGGRRWRAILKGVAVSSIDAIDPEHLWASVWHRGVGSSHALAMTTDGGRHWRMDRQLPTLADISMADPVDGWAIEERTAGNAKSQSAHLGTNPVIRTTDGGTTWTKTGALAQSICAAGPRTAWGGVGSKVMRTTDGGRSWSSRSLYPSPWFSASSIGCAGASTAWNLAVGGAAMSQQNYLGSLTVDGGRTWTPLLHEAYFPLPPNVGKVRSEIDAYSGSFAVVSGSTAFFAGSCAPCGRHPVSVTRTTDGGATFIRTRLRMTSTIGASPLAISFPDARHGWLLIGWQPTAQLWQTSDGGRTWTRELLAV